MTFAVLTAFTALAAFAAIAKQPAQQAATVLLLAPAPPQSLKIAYSKQAFGNVGDPPNGGGDSPDAETSPTDSSTGKRWLQKDQDAAGHDDEATAWDDDDVGSEEQRRLVRLRRQAAAERIGSIATLASGLGHDIGNVVLPILCRLDSLAALDLPDQAMQEIRAMRESVMHLRRLSGGLTMLGLDPRDAAASTVLTIMHQWWPEVEPLFLRALPKSAEFIVEIPEDLPAVIMPPHQLTQVLLNIVTNAGEAMERAGQVRLTAVAGQRSTVLIRVQDEGRGMTESVRRQALDPFFTTKKRGLSTGLGLAMAGSIVKSAGGSIEIDSAPGRGTTVSLTLPASKLQAQNGAARSASEGRVLLGDPRLAAYARAVLQGAGFTVLSSADPASSSEVLWIVDAGEQSIERAREFLSHRPERRALVVGPGADAFAGEPGFIIVNGSHRAMQRAMQRALLETPAALNHA